jgi:hypothetical protein
MLVFWVGWWVGVVLGSKKNHQQILLGVPQMWSDFAILVMIPFATISPEEMAKDVVLFSHRSGQPSSYLGGDN